MRYRNGNETIRTDSNRIKTRCVLLHWNFVVAIVPFNHAAPFIAHNQLKRSCTRLNGVNIFHIFIFIETIRMQKFLVQKCNYIFAKGVSVPCAFTVIVVVVIVTVCVFCTVLVCMCVCVSVQVWERSNICAHQNRNRLHLIELKINSICIQTFGISETCNKSMSTNTMPSVRAIFMDKSNCNPIVKPSHFVYLNCVWLKIVNSVLSIWSEVFCKQKKNKLSI